MNSNRLTLFAVVISALIIIAARLPSLARPIWNTDEGLTAVTANTILRGGTPYVDSVDQRAPLTYYVYALVFAAAGKNNMVAIHVVLIGVIVGVLVVLGLLARRVLPTRGVVFSLLYFAVASTLAFVPSDLLAFHTEWIVIFFTSLGVLFCWKGMERARPWGYALLCGVCYGLACFTKQPALLDLLSTLTFLSIVALVGPQGNTGVSRPQILKLMAGIIFGALAVAAGFCAYFVARGAWDDFVFYAWTYNTNYYMRALPWGKRLNNLYEMYFTLARSLELKGLAMCGGLVAAIRAAGWFGERTPIVWRQFHVALWGVSSLLAAFSGGRTFSHYLIMIFPSWCLLAGLTFDTVLNLLRVIVPAALPWGRKWLRIALIVARAVVLFGPCLLIQWRYAERYGLIIRNWEKYEADEPLLEYIRRECPSGERIIVWGFDPELYTEADRDPATRFSYTTFVVGLMPGVAPKSQADALQWSVPGTAKIFMDEIEKNRPLLIVDVSQSESIFREDFCGFKLFPMESIRPFASILSHSYQLVPQFSPGAQDDDGTRVYRRRD